MHEKLTKSDWKKSFDGKNFEGKDLKQNDTSGKSAKCKKEVINI